MGHPLWVEEGIGTRVMEWKLSGCGQAFTEDLFSPHVKVLNPQAPVSSISGFPQFPL